MKNLVKHVQNTNAFHHMWADFDTIIVGVSGGSDSMCLLHVLLEIARKENLTLIVAHVNYGLRGEDAKNDQLLVETVARENDIPCETLIVQQPVKGGEMQWRIMRYDFFEKLRIKYGAQHIAVAHNQNDQVETFLLHLLRGSGLAGFVGMRFVSCNYVVRPLLSVPREVILTYCTKHNISFHTDHTNSDTRFTRNRIRTQLVPYLQKNYNPQIISVLARTTEMIAEDIKIIEKQVDIFWKEDRKKKIVTFNARDFENRNIAVQRRALLHMIDILRGDTKDIEKGLIDEMCKVILSAKNKNQQFIGKNLKMHRKGDTVICAYYTQKP